MDEHVSAERLTAELGATDLRVLHGTVLGRTRPDGPGLLAHRARHLWQAGHVPGSAHLELGEQFSDRGSCLRIMAPRPDVDPDTGRYLPLAELTPRFAAAPDRSARVVTSCGGGIAASSDAFLLHRLRYRDVAVSDASLQEWAADPTLPLEVSP